MYNRVICARDSVLLSTVQYVMHFRFNDKNLLVCLARFAARVPSIYRAYHAERSITPVSYTHLTLPTKRIV